MMRNATPSGTSARRRAALQGGFTLLEIVISASILTMLILITARVLAGGQKLLGTTSIRSEGEMKAGDIAQQIAERIANGAISTLRDGRGALIDDGGRSTTGLSVALVDKFVGEACLKGSVGIQLGLDGETNVTNQVDDD